MTYETIELTIQTREEMTTAWAGTAAQGFFVPDLRVTMTLTPCGSDDLLVTFDYLDAGFDDHSQKHFYDVEMSSNNNDWASPRDQVEAMSDAITEWENRNLHQFINGRAIQVTGMG